MKLLSRWAASLNNCLISLFIIAYFSYSVAWLWLTAPSALRPSNSFATKLFYALAPFASLTGLEQSWAFFSPNLKIENSYTLLVISLQNGLLKLVELPRLEKLNLIKKMQQEKYRKLFNDDMTQPAYQFMLPDIARFEVRKNNERSNAPMRLAFFLISKPIPPPHIAGAFDEDKRLPRHASVEKYFVYGVSPDDL